MYDHGPPPWEMKYTGSRCRFIAAQCTLASRAGIEDMECRCIGECQRFRSADRLRTSCRRAAVTLPTRNRSRWMQTCGPRLSIRGRRDRDGDCARRKITERGASDARAVDVRSRASASIHFDRRGSMPRHDRKLRDRCREGFALRPLHGRRRTQTCYICQRATRAAPCTAASNSPNRSARTASRASSTPIAIPTCPCAAPSSTFRSTCATRATRT